MDLAGTSVPDDMDGVSLKTILMGKEAEVRGTYVVTYSMSPGVYTKRVLFIQKSYKFGVEYFGEGLPFGKSHVFLTGPYTPFYHGKDLLPITSLQSAYTCTYRL